MSFGTPKNMRNLNAVLVLGLVISTIASIGGGLILVMGYSQTNVTQPIWQFGQYVMIFGLINLVIYVFVAFQVRWFAKAI